MHNHRVFAFFCSAELGVLQLRLIQVLILNLGSTQIFNTNQTSRNPPTRSSSLIVLFLK